MYYVTRYEPGSGPRYARTRDWLVAVSLAYDFVVKYVPAWGEDDNGDCAITPVWCGPECWNEPSALGGYEIREGGDGDKHVAAVITEGG